MGNYYFTSESVTEGHPDKMCDAISDAILDAVIEQDPMGRVACETAITTGLVVVMGEITTRAYIDISQIVRNTISEIGYDDIQYGFDAKTCCILTCINGQSNDIAIGVDKAFELKKADNISNKIESLARNLFTNGVNYIIICKEFVKSLKKKGETVSKQHCENG